MISIPLLYQDNSIIVANKPAGLLVVPTPKGEERTLTTLLERQLRDAGQNPGVYPCHRLDRDTSGVIIYARTKADQERIMEQFKCHQVTKIYIAFIQGRLEKLSGEIRSHIDTRYPYFSAKGNWGKLAITRYNVREIRDQFTIIEARPITGRTNQLRIHFRQLRHPIIGERKYAFGRDFPLKFRRVALHAGEIKFRHPRTNHWLKIKAALPEDMKNFCVKNR